MAMSTYGCLRTICGWKSAGRRWWRWTRRKKQQQNNWQLGLIFLMNKNFAWKLALIFGTLLVFLFGIFGIPRSFSKQGLAEALTNRIHLGLDLKGGTHLILQVQV